MSRKSIFDLTREDYQRLEQDEEQLDRFEKARRAKLPVPRVRKVAGEVACSVPDDEFCIALAGATKIFVAELVEEARAHLVAAHSRPLGPTDIEAAFDRFMAEGRIPQA